MDTTTPQGDEVSPDLRDLALIRDALRYLPAVCRYHGEKLTLGERYPETHGDRPDADEPCCDTGAAPLARRRAVIVYDEMRAERRR